MISEKRIVETPGYGEGEIVNGKKTLVINEKQVLTVLKRQVCGGTPGTDRVYRIFARVKTGSNITEEWLTLGLTDDTNGITNTIGSV
jgi:hypothetical protein